MMHDDTLSEFFEIGDIDGYEPPKDDGFPLLEASKTVWTPGADGKRERKEDPVYLFKLNGPCKPGKDRFGEDALVGRATSVHPAKTEPKRRVSMAVEIPKFVSKETIREQVLADDRVPESLKEERIEKRITGLGWAKGKAAMLAKALVGSNDIRALSGYLQSPDAEGAMFGASVSVRRWDTGAANQFMRFYPVSEATERVPE